MLKSNGAIVQINDSRTAHMKKEYSLVKSLLSIINSGNKLVTDGVALLPLTEPSLEPSQLIHTANWCNFQAIYFPTCNGCVLFGGSKRDDPHHFFPCNVVYVCFRLHGANARRMVYTIERHLINDKIRGRIENG